MAGPVPLWVDDIERRKSYSDKVSEISITLDRHRNEDRRGIYDVLG